MKKRGLRQIGFSAPILFLQNSNTFFNTNTNLVTIKIFFLYKIMKNPIFYLKYNKSPQQIFYIKYQI